MPIMTIVVTYQAGSLVLHAGQRRLVQLAFRSQLGQIIFYCLVGETFTAAGVRRTFVQSGQWSETSTLRSIP
jgi:hypothetical protein